MQRSQFTFYRSFWESVQHLPAKERLRVLEAIARYALDGEDSTFSGTGAAIFSLIKPVLDSSAKKASIGSSGGRSKPKANGKQNGSEGESESENENETETETETEKKNEIENEREIQTETETEDGVRPCRLVVWPNGVRMIDSPFLEEIERYCREIGSRVDPEAFMDYYNEREWKIDGKFIRNWKAVLRSWEANELSDGLPKGGMGYD